MEHLDVRLDFERFPQRHACDGENISQKIEIAGLGTPYIAVIMDDPDAPGGTFSHWLIWNIPARDVIPEGVPADAEVSSPFRAVQGRNDFGDVGYGGPCPPKGATHRFFIRVYGMREAIGLPAGAGRRELETALQAVAVQYGEAMALYSRKARVVP
ncbi:MAG: YbhB/YbcL family Raf kinase inhibitor-like protein [Methanomicrobiaceae archaeon]|uniref:Phospholipid-binding protein n=1 Tax=hydrocarbon metagenome TaxID=938273 RepID=A0A0W8FHZ3_9ZZZZ|nr:YbhB/YbcL family Raf kinase inhibitor-like protein [Methanomicrobiaceae archaeon]MDD5419377.1 YbhB/YbcL family Raf kinase inhibitor-like protein [Methanomicrobiaceae archaeon]